MSVSKDKLLSSLPSLWKEDTPARIRELLPRHGRKIIVLDDDPTGTQTVHDVRVLTRWSIDVLMRELKRPEPLVFILTNSRSMSPASAEVCYAEIALNLLEARRYTGRDFTIISRSDSTLRGHYPLETDTLEMVLGGQFDATLIIPAFFDGGRYTINNVHYVAEDDLLVPAGETQFARDAVFGYQSSDLRDWVEEKTEGRISRDQVISIPIDMIRKDGPQAIYQQLMNLSDGVVCVVNAAHSSDLSVVAYAALGAELEGKRFLYRTAADFVASIGGIPPRDLLTIDDLSYHVPGKGGLVVVGSYVPQTTDQLNVLLEGGSVTSVEMDVESVLQDGQRPNEITRCARLVSEALAAAETVVLYTSRKLITGDDPQSSIMIGHLVSESLVKTVSSLTSSPSWVVAKGGITSSDIATRALKVTSATVAGQIIPGVPVWTLNTEAVYPGLSYVIFPGNVGEKESLLHVVEILQSRS